MTDSRQLKSIAARYDLDAARRPNRLKRVRKRVSILVLFGTVLLTLPFMFADHRGLESRSVSRTHRTIEKNCQICHDQNFAPLQRLITLNNHVHSTSDAACLQCHVESNLDHIDHHLVEPNLLASLAGNDSVVLKEFFEKIGCAGCHQEHRGLDLIQTVDDRYCTGCHGRSAHVIADSEFALDFKDFESHPRFAIHREHAAEPHARHRSLALTTVIDGERKDRAGIRFNHHRHLDPELPRADRSVNALDCQNCHEPDQSGENFLPISFERHCQQCHQLGFKQTGPLPHATPEIVRGLILDHLAKQPPTTPASTDVLGGPTKPPATAEKMTETREWAEFQKRLEQFDARLFGEQQVTDGRTSAKARLETACTKCHLTQQDAQDQRVPWSIAPTSIPRRWLPHGNFRHVRHPSVACSQCHSRGGETLQLSDRNQFYPELSAELMDSKSIFASRSAEDILIPEMKTCQQCHGNAPTAVFLVGANATCVTCHDYHHNPPESATSRQLMQFMIESTGKK